MRPLLGILPLAVLTLACAGDAPSADADDAPKPRPAADGPARADIAGTYAVAGTNPDGSAYDGTLTVTRHGDVYQFSWQTGNDYEGIGLVAGDAVAVGWGGEGCGAVLYRVDGGTLEGRWALYGTEAVGTERATRAAGTSRTAGSVAGAYQIEGTNPDGSPYTGTLAVEPDGPAYRLTWESGGTYLGEGLLDGDVFGTSYGGEACGVALYRVGRDGTLEGMWATYGEGATGTERAVRQ